MKTSFTAPGEGRSIWVVGDLCTIKASGDDTGGAFARVEALVHPAAGPLPHIHRREDETFYILEGDVEFHADGRTFRAGVGTWITLARGSLHWFENVGSSPARMLIMVTPSGLENYLLEVGREATGKADERVDSTPEDVNKLLVFAPKYGLEFTPPP